MDFCCPVPQGFLMLKPRISKFFFWVGGWVVCFFFFKPQKCLLGVPAFFGNEFFERDVDETDENSC